MNETNLLPNNQAKFAAKSCHLPALGSWLHDALPNEPYDPHFLGQELRTTYFDSEAFCLRKARKSNGRYATLRIRRYPGDTFVLQIKTQTEKWRQEIASTAYVLQSGFTVSQLTELVVLPGSIIADLMAIAGEEELIPVVTVCYRRYAVENATRRVTLDTDVHTDKGQVLPFHVLELKGDAAPQTPNVLLSLGLRPIKLSKFLWATEV